MPFACLQIENVSTRILGSFLVSSERDAAGTAAVPSAPVRHNASRMGIKAGSRVVSPQVVTIWSGPGNCGKQKRKRRRPHPVAAFLALPMKARRGETFSQRPCVVHRTPVEPQVNRKSCANPGLSIRIHPKTRGRWFSGSMAPIFHVPVPLDPLPFS